MWHKGDKRWLPSLKKHEIVHQGSISMVLNAYNRVSFKYVEANNPDWLFMY